MTDLELRLIINENARLKFRIEAAENLLEGFTARDLCGENTWACDTCDELLDEFLGDGVEQRYRFFSYGDAMFIPRRPEPA